MVETQESKITIRDYQEGDWETVRQQLHAMNRELQQMDPMGRIEHKPGADEFFTRQVVEKVNDGSGFVLLAIAEGVVVGMVAGFRHDQDEEEKLDMKPARPGKISDLFVVPAYRQRGLGRRLLYTAEDRLKHMGCDVVSMEVFIPNQVAVRFYRKENYQERGMVMMKEL